jgi:hypothetical protein
LRHLAVQARRVKPKVPKQERQPLRACTRQPPRTRHRHTQIYDKKENMVA